MRLALLIGLSAAVPLAIYASYYIVGPYVDNWLGVLTRRDLHRFHRYPVGDTQLRDIVERRVGPCEWSSRHDEVMWASVIRCQSLAGRAYSWELSNLPPRPWLRPAVYVTPLSRDAAELVPEVLPPQIKDPRRVPFGQYAARVIYDIAQPDEARAWFERSFRRAPLRHDSAGGPTTR
jgi:hypothetical protein